MLKRLKVQNFRTLDDFEWRPPVGISVLVGDNGSGKSTVGAVLRALTRFLVAGEEVHEVFSSADRSRWNSQSWRQTFELDFDGPIGTFEYSLELGFDSQKMTPWVATEKVQLGDRVLYDFDGASGHLLSSPPVSFPLTNSRSYLGIVEPQTARVTLMGFKDVLRRVLALKLDPERIGSMSTREEARIEHDGSNFAAVYRAFAANEPEQLQAYFTSLSGPIPGFRVLKTREAGAQFETVATLDVLGGGTTFRLEQLSDGQRQLLVLYLLLQQVEQGSVLFLDEPDNYLALREIQPWLAELDRIVSERRAQAFLVTHQAEAMDYLASRNAFLFSRPNRGGTVVETLEDGSLPSDAALYGAQASE